MHVQSFDPVLNAQSRVLILGSMPGKVSLLAGEYYAHPRNLFWRLMEELLGVDRSAPYRERTAQLLARRVGLWDVLKACTRGTSLDSDIVPSSEDANDFAGLFEKCPEIRVVCFNGAKAAASFRRRVMPCLGAREDIVFHALPSTSPANASIPWTKKREAWRVVSAAETLGQHAVP
jgi:TDG/mug DNA glycosylase family protein